MANPIYQAMKGHMGPKGGVMGPTAQIGPSGGPMAFIRKFPQFMDQMKGQNPSQLIQQALTSGQLSQAQLDQAQKMAQQLEGQLSGFRSMFGF